MLKVYLLRHGETTYNADNNRYCGRTNAQLTEKGLAQAALVAAQLAGKEIAAVYASPLDRAKITATIASGNKTVITDERLIELDFGNWEGKTREEFIAENAAAWDAWITAPDNNKAGLTGENAVEVITRVDAFYNEMLSRHNSQTIMVVGHNGINRLYMAYKLGMPLKNYRQLVQENSSITLFELDNDGGFSLHLLNSKG